VGGQDEEDGEEYEDDSEDEEEEEGKTATVPDPTISTPDKNKLLSE